MKKIYLFLIVYMAFSNLAHANWGGFNYGSVASGDFMPVGTNQVEILNENLRIDLYQSRALVRVSYDMQNSGGAIEIKAGFPCITDYIVGLPEDFGANQNDYKEINNYSITADGVTLQYQESGPEKVSWLTIPLDSSNFEYMDENGYANTNGDENAKVSRSLKVLWLVSKLNFKPNEKHHVVISYTSDYLADGGGGSDSSIRGESDIYDPRYFRYLLSTGNVWKGPIQKGNIVIRALSVDADKITLNTVERFTRDGNVFSWSFKDLKPDLADNIEICLNDDFSVFVPDNGNGPFASYKNPISYFRDFKQCKVFSSSERSSKYLAKNLIDWDGRTAWVAGGHMSGIGESVTFIFDKPMKIAQVGIASGYVKSERLYFANNRPSTIQISLDDQPPVIKVLPDEYINCCYNQDRDYQWLSLNEDEKPVHKMVLKILGVYKGDRYDDTCISEIFFREKLKKDPSPN